MNLRECLREAVRDTYYCRELINALMEDLEDMSNVHESELATPKAELDRRGSAPPGTEVECVQLRSRVAGLEGDFTAFTQRFTALDHS